MEDLDYIYTEITYYRYKKEENYNSNPEYIHKIIHDFMDYVSNKDCRENLIKSYERNGHRFLNSKYINHYKNILLSCDYTLDTFLHVNDKNRWLRMIDIVQRLICLAKADEQEANIMIEENVTLGYMFEYYKHILDYNILTRYESRDYMYKTFFKHIMMENETLIIPLLPIEVIEYIKK